MSYGPEEGNDHTCPDCGAKWWDSDGGCSCTKCRHCGKVGDEDFAADGYCADCKDAEIERRRRAWAFRIAGLDVPPDYSTITETLWSTGL